MRIQKIELQGIAKKIGKQRIITDFSYHFQNGTMYALTGHNGSGKTTLLQIIAGMISASKGSIKYIMDNGKEIKDIDLPGRISYAAPYLELVDELTLTEIYELHFKNIEADIPPVKEFASSMGLPADALDKKYKNFSTGMKSRLKLGLAFYYPADILFLDEPGSNLDEAGFEIFASMVQKYAKDKICILASNEKKEIALADEVIDVAGY